MVHRHEIRVRYGETDGMGVVHHSVYPLYFEEARTELMRASGLRYADLEDRGWLLPLTDIGIRFLRGPVYDDVLVLEARLTELTKIRLRLEYRVLRKGTDELLATGFTRHASTGRDLRPRRLPEDVIDTLGASLESPEGEEEAPGRRQTV